MGAEIFFSGFLDEHIKMRYCVCAGENNEPWERGYIYRYISREPCFLIYISILRTKIWRVFY